MTVITIQPRQETRQAVTAGDDDTPTVLIVEDEQHLADLYTDYWPTSTTYRRLTAAKRA